MNNPQRADHLRSEELRELSEKTDLPLAVVERNLPMVRAATSADTSVYDEILDNPQLRAELQQRIDDRANQAALQRERDDLIHASIAVGGILAFGLLFFSLWRFRRRLTGYWGRSHTLRATVSGYAVWSLMVTTYLVLMDPHLKVNQILAWIALPPLCAAACSTWVRCFWLRTNNHNPKRSL